MSLPSDPFNPFSPPAARLDGPGDVVAAANGAGIPPTVIDLLAKTRPWVRFLAVLLVVALGLAIVAVAVVLTVVPRTPGAPTPALTMIPMVLVLLVYIPPSIYLWRYARGIQRLQAGKGLPALEEALANQKSFWKYSGILAIVLMCVYGLGGVFALLGFFAKPHAG
jgi:hypothetical protein